MKRYIRSSENCNNLARDIENYLTNKGINYSEVVCDNDDEDYKVIFVYMNQGEYNYTMLYNLAEELKDAFDASTSEVSDSVHEYICMEWY